MTPTVLNPTVTLTVQGQPITVHELKAVHLFQLLKLFHGQLNKFADEKGDLKVSAASFLEIVMGAEDLFRFVMVNSTRRDAAWVETIDLGEAAAILDAAWQLNQETLIKNAPALKGLTSQLLGRMMTRTPKNESPAQSTIS